MLTHMQPLHARTHQVLVLLCRQSLLGLSERNDYHTSVSTSLSPACVCHVPISYSNSDIYWQQHWSLYANADCGQMSARGFECMSFHPLCVFGMLIHHDPSLPLSSIATIVHIVYVTAEIHWTELYSPPQRVVIPTRGRCCPSSALPRGSVFLEWHVWLSTATTSEWCQREPH